MKNYTTKPIELPLSTEKEYVLVDVEGYKKAYSLNELIMNECNITEPFKFDVVDVDGLKGFIDKIKNTSVVSDRYKEHIHFHEVIRQPESEVEWKNGDECTYDGSRYIFVGMTPNFNDVSCIIFDPKNGIEHVSVGKLRKPETESERKERDRLEAAYELYNVFQDGGVLSFDNFKTSSSCSRFLAIVDKTNYRREQN